MRISDWSSAVCPSDLASDTPLPAMARFDFSVQLEGLSSPGRQPMLKVVDRFNRTREHVALRSMFEARKRFFVDELGWDLPVLAGLYEVDQFDDGHATYLIVVDQDDRHLDRKSTRLNSSH